MIEDGAIRTRIDRTANGVEVEIRVDIRHRRIRIAELVDANGLNPQGFQPRLFTAADLSSRGRAWLSDIVRDQKAREGLKAPSDEILALIRKPIRGDRSLDEELKAHRRAELEGARRG